FKPANVLIDAEGRARVSDFGLARGGALVGGDAPASQAEVTAELSGGLLEAPLTRTGAVLGTPAYMSPEQFRGEVVTPRSDLFSFCVVVWEAIFGQRPFLGASVGEVVGRIEAGRLSPPPRSIRTPHWLRRTLERGLARRPGDRFASMGELLDALGHHGHHTHRGLRGAGRTFAMTSAAAAMAMAFGILLVALDGGSKGERPQDPETSAAAVAERACDETRSELEAGWSDAARASLGERLGAAGVPASPVLDALDRMVADWHEVHDARCAARADDDGGAFVGDDLCLEDRRRDLLAAITSLGEASDVELADADGLVSMIPSVHECQLPKLTLSSVNGFGERHLRADRWAKRRAIAWAFAPRAMSRAPETFEVIAERGKDQWSDKRLAVEHDLAHATFLAAKGEVVRRPLLATRASALEGMPDLQARTRALDLEALEATPHSRAHLAETWTAAYDAYRALPRRHPLREALSLDLGVLALSHAAHAGAVGCVDPARADAGCEPVRAAVELLGDRLALREDHL
ncbi:MAG: protein kinase, partial [Myxococcales bacterium]|nr:protein kinase [Myxococcales bacterium]